MAGDGTDICKITNINDKGQIAKNRHTVLYDINI